VFKRGASPSYYKNFPLSFLRRGVHPEGDTGGEVDKQFDISCLAE